jgi:hypothetical protein
VKDVEKYKTLIDVLTVRVAEIENERSDMDAKMIERLFDRVTVLENEMIDKDLRISKLDNELFACQKEVEKL